MDLEKVNNLELLKGEISNFREYVITLGQTQGSKGVMFVLYAVNKNPNANLKPLIYLGQLSDKLEKAIVVARERCGIYQIEIDTDKTFRERRVPNTIPFGKYKGLTVETLFDKDAQYLYWLANNIYKCSETLLNELTQYKEIAKELITKKNAKTSLPFLPIETKKSLKTELTIYYYNRNVDFDEFSPDYRYKLVDKLGNKYSYSGKKFLGKKDEIVDLNMKIKRHWDCLGVHFNVLAFR